MMELWFFITLWAPLILWLIALLFNAGDTKKMLRITATVYAILGVIALVLRWTWFTFQSDLLIVDHINIPFFALIIVLSAIISLYAITYFTKELDHRAIWFARLKQYNVLINFFVFAMLIVATSSNLIIMWIGIEATTIFTAFLISFYNTKDSWEAAWKYVIICSVGVTLWLLGLFMLSYAGLPMLNISSLLSTDLHSIAINIPLMKLAFLFIFVWFGTKVGLFPMNSWLPDAHGKGSTPISAFMSSILLPLAFYIILRAKSIIDVIIWPDFTNTLLIIFGLISVVYAWCMLLIQHHFKRALAYSSSENMGIIAFAFGLGTPLATIFGYLHIIGHSFLKTASFMSLGNVLLDQWTGQIDKVSRLLHYMKKTGILTIISLFLLLWLPPSPLFFSEIGIISQAFTNSPRYAIIFIIWLILAFVGIVVNFSKLFAPTGENTAHTMIAEKGFNKTHSAIIIAILCALGSTVAFFLTF